MEERKESNAKTTVDIRELEEAKSKLCNVSQKSQDYEREAEPTGSNA